jgi:hypothetical protein
MLLWASQTEMNWRTFERYESRNYITLENMLLATRPCVPYHGDTSLMTVITLSQRQEEATREELLRSSVHIILLNQNLSV